MSNAYDDAVNELKAAIGRMESFFNRAVENNCELEKKNRNLIQGLSAAESGRLKAEARADELCSILETHKMANKTNCKQIVEMQGVVKALKQELEQANNLISILKAQRANWIPFTKESPKLYQNILVNVPHAELTRMEPVRSIIWCPARVDEFEHDMLYYTHWQPAPLPPKTKEDGNGK